MDKIVCVGKNYLDHARELGERVPERPVLFIKPPSILRAFEGKTIEAILPAGRGEVHHECEIVVRLDSRGRIEALTLGLDMTLRDAQATLKKNGHPWEISKVFADSAIIGPWVSREDLGADLDLEFTFTVDGEIRQRGRVSEMRFDLDECVAYAAEYFPLRTGDLIFTGTPAGVGPIRAGQSGRLRWGRRIDYTVNWT